jgi:HK97 family phage major capsid protein
VTEPTTARMTSDSDFAGFLPAHRAEAYFDEARKASVLQTLGRKVPLGINGEEIPVVTSKATAYWTAEGGRKKQSKGTVGLKSMKPQKITSIAVVSAEVVRANPRTTSSCSRPTSPRRWARRSTTPGSTAPTRRSAPA